MAAPAANPYADPPLFVNSPVLPKTFYKNIIKESGTYLVNLVPEKVNLVLALKIIQVVYGKKILIPQEPFICPPLQ